MCMCERVYVSMRVCVYACVCSLTINDTKEREGTRGEHYRLVKQREKVYEGVGDANALKGDRNIRDKTALLMEICNCLEMKYIPRLRSAC